MTESLKSEFIEYIVMIIGDRENLRYSEVLHVASPLAKSFNFAGISEKDFLEQISEVREIAPAYTFSSVEGFYSLKGQHAIKCQACIDNFCQEAEFEKKQEAISFFLNFGSPSEEIKVKRLVYNFLAEKYQTENSSFYEPIISYKGDGQKVLEGLKAFNIDSQELIEDYIEKNEFEEDRGLFFKSYRDYDGVYQSIKSQDLRAVVSSIVFGSGL